MRTQSAKQLAIEEDLPASPRSGEEDDNVHEIRSVHHQIEPASGAMAKYQYNPQFVLGESDHKSGKDIAVQIHSSSNMVRNSQQPYSRFQPETLPLPNSTASQEAFNPFKTYASQYPQYASRVQQTQHNRYPSAPPLPSSESVHQRSGRLFADQSPYSLPLDQLEKAQQIQQLQSASYDERPSYVSTGVVDEAAMDQYANAQGEIELVEISCPACSNRFHVVDTGSEAQYQCPFCSSDFVM